MLPSEIFVLKTEKYQGLGQLYVNNNRSTKVDGEPNLEFAEFMSRAMNYFVEEY